MVAISFEADIKPVERMLSHFGKKQLPFATSRALNTLAFKMAKEQMPKVVDKTFTGGATAFMMQIA